jgi:hypothetical protein
MVISNFTPVSSKTEATGFRRDFRERVFQQLQDIITIYPEVGTGGERSRMFVPDNKSREHAVRGS